MSKVIVKIKFMDGEVREYRYNTLDYAIGSIREILSLYSLLKIPRTIIKEIGIFQEGE